MPFFDIYINGRIYSNFQYANAFGAYEATIFFLTVYLSVTAKSFIKRNISIVYSFLILSGLLFSQSRASIIIFIFIYCI